MKVSAADRESDGLRRAGGGGCFHFFTDSSFSRLMNVLLSKITRLWMREEEDKVALISGAIQVAKSARIKYIDTS